MRQSLNVRSHWLKVKLLTFFIPRHVSCSCIYADTYLIGPSFEVFCSAFTYSLVPLRFLFRLSTRLCFSDTDKLQKHKLVLHDCVFPSFSSYFPSFRAKYSLLIVLLEVFHGDSGFQPQVSHQFKTTIRYGIFIGFNFWRGNDKGK